MTLPAALILPGIALALTAPSMNGQYAAGALLMLAGVCHLIVLTFQIEEGERA